MTTLEGAGVAPPAGPGSFAAPTSEALLRAAHDSATDLASVRDRAVILRALVRRTRALLGADMAYLSLNDLEAGETWIHVTDGVRTPAYAAIRMPLGTGILGSVAAGGTSVHTDDYLADADLNHLQEIDAVVAAEGVRAISGEPLRVDGHLVGALLVAQRSPVAMPPEGLAALRLLALQAAVALEQTRRAEEIAELRARVVSARSEAARSADLLALDARLLAAVPGGSQAVVDELVAVLASPVALVDDDGGRLRCGAPSAVGAPTSVAVPAGAPGRPGGAASRLTTEAAGPATEAALGRGALAVGLAQHVEHALAEAADHSAGALLDDLLDERADAGSPGSGGADRAARRGVLEARAQAHGVDLRVPAASLVVLVPPGQRQRSVAALRPLVARGGLVTVHAGHVCVVCTAGGPGTPPGTGTGTGTGTGSGAAGRADALGTRAEEALAAAGVAGVVGCAAADQRGAAPLARAHAEAAQVARAAQVLGWRSGHADRARLGIAGLLLGGHDDRVVEALVDRHLGPVLTYDAEHGTRLAETAAAVLEEGSRTAAAARLFVHVNTVRQRVERLDALLGTGWDSAPRSLDVQAALRLRALRDEGRAS